MEKKLKSCIGDVLFEGGAVETAAKHKQSLTLLMNAYWEERSSLLFVIEAVKSNKTSSNLDSGLLRRRTSFCQ
jgi:hypothetical protein